jgi:hypothetical protein
VGYVGSGMLTAAVAGEVFASPPTSAVLAAIRAVTGPGGCLLVIKNYTGGASTSNSSGSGPSPRITVAWRTITYTGSCRVPTKHSSEPTSFSLCYMQGMLALAVIV